MTYRPGMSPADEERIRAWHDSAYESLRDAGEQTVDCLGRTLVVPRHVFPPALTSELLRDAVLAEVRENDRVLDMGTGSGVNAILAASRSTDVLGVDVNPVAVEAAVANAARNGVADRITFRVSDVFDEVHGQFDLIVFDPPFRWFAPRDLIEASMADENYAALTRFLTEAAGHLTPDGRILMFFGTSGDLDYLYRVADENGFVRETVSSKDFTQRGVTISNHAFRLRRPAR